MSSVYGLDLSDLHASLQDPVLGSIGFLNEIMGRFPDAISFAPGAPHPDFVNGIEPQQYVEHFRDYLIYERGLNATAAERLLYEYGPSQGIINDLVATALNRDQAIPVVPDAMVITVGAQEAMFLTLRALFRSPKEILVVPEPSFTGIVGSARLLELTVAGVQEEEGGLDLAELTRMCAAARRQGQRIRACYVAPDYSNPGGARMPLPQRRRLLELAEREDFYLIEDNTYGFTAPSDLALPCLKALDTSQRVIHIGTFAKICFPGARVGYVVADQIVKGSDGQVFLAHHLAALKSMVTVNTSPLNQALVAGMLLEHGTSLTRMAQHKAERYRINLQHLVEALQDSFGEAAGSRVRWNRPTGGLFIRMQLTVPAGADLLEVSAREYGVLWTPMSQFYIGSQGDHQIRLSCSYLDPEQIRLGIQRLAEFVKKETEH